MIGALHLVIVLVDQTSHTTITALGATLATLIVMLLILLVVAVIVTIIVMRRKGFGITYTYEVLLALTVCSISKLSY